MDPDDLDAIQAQATEVRRTIEALDDLTQIANRPGVSVQPQALAAEQERLQDALVELTYRANEVLDTTTTYERRGTDASVDLPNPVPDRTESLSVPARPTQS